jgi:hypothetical protein
MRLAVSLSLWLSATTAHAGLDCDPKAEIAELEAFAKDKAADPEQIWFCLPGSDPSLKPRVDKACTSILKRDGDKSPCVRVAAAAGIAKLGDRDLVPLVAALEEDPIEESGGFGYYRATLLARIGDPRGAKLIVDWWKAAQPRADAREKKRREMASWSSWRRFAAEALGTLGGAEDQAFLEDQAKATRDKYVAQACRDGAASIAKRLAAKP